MKNTLVRVFVLALAVVGFSASSVATSRTAKTSKVPAASQTVASVPLCVPSDPSHCGMD